MPKHGLLTDYDPLLQRLDRESAERSGRVRNMLREQGREDLVAEFDRNMKDVHTGVSQARGCWHALSAAQRQVLEILAQGTALVRSGNSVYVLHGHPNGFGLVAGRLPTMRNLSARELVAPDGGAFDPERRFVMTERGKFVLKHGPSTPK